MMKQRFSSGERCVARRGQVVVTREYRCSRRRCSFTCEATSYANAETAHRNLAPNWCVALARRQAWKREFRRATGKAIRP